MKLSILIICFNQESTIKRAIDSILNQEHSYSYELIICDDCSTDATPQIIEEYQQNNPGIIKAILRQHNLGLIKNYYDGISRIHGEYLMVCAGDDYWLPGKVGKQIQYLDANNEIGLLYGDAKCVDIIGHEQKSPFWGTNINTFDSFLAGNHICAPSIAVRVDLLKKYLEQVAPMEKDWKMEDYPMILWYACNSKITYLKGEIVGYTIQNESASHSKSIRKLKDILKSDYDVKQYFIDKYRNGSVDYDIEYRHLLTLCAYLHIADDEFRTLCMNQLQRCSLTDRRRMLFMLRIKFPTINYAYVGFRHLLSKIGI